MSDKALSKEKLNIILNGVSAPSHLEGKHLHYVVEKAVAGDQVIYRMAIQNNVLYKWARMDEEKQNYVVLLNEVIPEKAVRVKENSKRVQERIRLECFRLVKKLKQKQRSGSKKQRSELLNGWTNVSILASDIVTPVELETEIKRTEEKLISLMEKLDGVNIEVAEWRGKYKNLEEETKALFEELKEESATTHETANKKILKMEKENKEMKKYMFIYILYGSVLLSGVEKNNDVARATVLHKSRNWDSPADVIRVEHRVEQLSHRERHKRKYTKHNEDFWMNGKKDLMRKNKKKCISSQNVSEKNDVEVAVNPNSNPSDQSNKKRKRNSKKKTVCAAKKTAKKK